MDSRGAFDRNAQREFALFGNAFLLANQPLRLELDIQVTVKQGRFEIWRDNERHSQ